MLCLQTKKREQIEEGKEKNLREDGEDVPKREGKRKRKNGRKGEEREKKRLCLSLGLYKGFPLDSPVQHNIPLADTDEHLG